MTNHPNRSTAGTPDATLAACRLTYTTKKGADMERRFATITLALQDANKIVNRAGYRNVTVWAEDGRCVRRLS